MLVHERTLPVVRQIEATDLQVVGKKLAGYAVLWNVRTKAPVDVGGVLMVEVIEPHAFTVSERNIPFSFGHKEYAEYGDTESGTLRLKPDDVGIPFELDLPNYANYLRQQVETKALTGMSFGFQVKDMLIREDIRYIVKGDLLHISPVYNPAYPTSFGLRSSDTSKLKRMRMRVVLLEKMTLNV